MRRNDPQRTEKEQRSWVMSRIRGKDTTPELRVRSLIHRAGLRFRLHAKSLPGRPDIVLPRYQTVVFVHGCFWHRHRRCKYCRMPKSNRSYWVGKLMGNQRRDQLHLRALRRLGWHVLVIWECETENSSLMERKISHLAIRLRHRSEAARVRFSPCRNKDCKKECHSH